MEEPGLSEVHQWATVQLGALSIASSTREHPDRKTGVRLLRTARGDEYYLKTLHDEQHWAREVHAYERWTKALDRYAPRLVAARDTKPLALIITALPGRILEGCQLPAAQERAIWRAAGAALARLHALPSGVYFGSCKRDGTSVLDHPVRDARSYLTAEFKDLMARGERACCLTAEELAIVRSVAKLIEVAFVGERPCACHRDYCPANWVVKERNAGQDGQEGAVFSGVIDFEFSYWDVRSADFSRHPEWQWVHRLDLIEAFDAGYAEHLTPPPHVQKLVSRVLYALGAIVWGCENNYRDFEQEGRVALRHVGAQLVQHM